MFIALGDTQSPILLTVGHVRTVVVLVITRSIDCGLKIVLQEARNTRLTRWVGFFLLPSSPPKKLLLNIQDGEKRDFPLREGSKKKGQARKKRNRKSHLTKVSPSTSNCLFGSLDCVMGGAWTPPTAPVKVCRLLASGGPCLGSSPSLNS